MAQLDHRHDDRFYQQGFAAPLMFLGLFILFVYGSLLLGLIECANWFIRSYNFVFFSELGAIGTGLMVVAFLIGWLVIVAVIAAIPYYLLRWFGKKILAEKVATIISLFLFHIFATPFILWPMVRNGSPKLRRAYRQKLKKMVSSTKMRERLEERRENLLNAQKQPYKTASFF